MKNVELIAVVAAVLDQKHLTLYKDDGTTVVIPQGDARIAPIMEKLKESIPYGQTAIVNIAQQCPYKEFESKSNGFVKFFKATKKFLAEVLTGEKSVEDLKQVSSTNNLSEVDDSEETLVAIDKENNVINDVQNLHNQIEYASAGNTVGMEKFLARLSKVSNDRRHSAEDLLKFMERGDLPIAEDGSIIIYKILRKDKSKDSYFLDCHTGKVPQRVGSYVHMDPELVDPSRSNECSNGLHVARRGYVGSFSGDVCVLAKVNPEDVIAVPSYDANKMRVCGYHILFELPEECYAQLKKDKPMTAVESGKEFLAKALTGQHDSPIEMVKIGGHMGTDITVTVLNQKEKTPAPVGNKMKKANAISVNKNAKKSAPVVDFKSVGKKVTAKPVSRKDKAAELTVAIAEALTQTEQIRLAKELLAFKKQCKVGWDILGVPKKTISTIEKLRSDKLL